MAPVIHRLRAEPRRWEVCVLTTGQHRELLSQALAEFSLTPDANLDIMRPNQRLDELTARALCGLGQFFRKNPCDMVLAQGDTTTVLAAALACYYERIPFAHVEAGLRTGDPYFPFPEEKNRVLAGHLAELHFAPTVGARANLVREGIDPGRVHVTGNTVIDALLMTARQSPPLPLRPPTERFILMTMHRRENFGQPMREVCRAVRDLAYRYEGLSFVFPVHPNPNVRSIVESELASVERVALIEPIGYRGFVALMQHAWLLLTDSGGIQEEGPSLGKPVLVLRDETERPEAVEAGTVQLVGPHYEAITAAVERFWRQPMFAPKINPYGDGRAAERIERILAAWAGFTQKDALGDLVTEWSQVYATV